MVLTQHEKVLIVVSHLISLYSERMEKGKIPQNQSVVDFLLENIPLEFKSDLTMNIIDDVFNFISGRPMELS